MDSPHSAATHPWMMFFHWFPSMPNLQITAITGLWQQFWPDWGGEFSILRLQLFLRISLHHKVEAAVTASQICFSFRKMFQCLLREKKIVTSHAMVAVHWGVWGHSTVHVGFLLVVQNKGFLQFSPRWLLKWSFTALLLRWQSCCHCFRTEKELW